MGFFDFMDRMAKGEPIFQDNTTKPEEKLPQSEGTAEGPDSKINKAQSSTFPVAYVKRVKSHVNGSRLQVYGWIANTWPEPIELDKIRIFNAKRELDTVLGSHEEREFLLYDGPLLTHEYHEAQLDYKTKKEGDYFQAVHHVSYSYHADDKTYEASEIHLEEPIRDIYG